MAAAKAKPVGSAAWIAAEKENVANLIEQELEEIEFPVRHELDWLNEHMAEIFSNNQFNMTELLKTPGKMRGKTPRTARKRNPDESRVPLNEIFTASNQKPKVPSRFTAALEKSATILKPSTEPSEQSVPEAVEEQPDKNPAEPSKVKQTASSNQKAQSKAKTTDANVSVSKGKEPGRDQLVTSTSTSTSTNNNKALNSFSTYNTDSGYHGLPDEEDDAVLADTQILPDSPRPADTQVEADPSTQPFELNTTPKVQHRKSESVDRRTTDQSFHSAQENIRSRGETVEPMDVTEDHPEVADEDTPRQFARAISEQPGHPAQAEAMTQSKLDLSDAPDQDEDMALDDNFDDLGSPSDNSTPARPPMRKKSSLSFASLPAREPLIKKSVSRTSHLDMIKPTGPGRQSYFGGQNDGLKPSTLGFNMETEDQRQDAMDLDKKQKPLQTELDDRYGTSKSSTQRLHDKISMLGKTQPARTTKSIAPSQQQTSQVNYPDLTGAKSNIASVDSAPKAATTSQDDWIKPLESPHKANIPKSQTADIMERVGGNDSARNTEKGTHTRAETIHDLRDRRSPTPKGSAFSTFGHHKSASTSTPPSRRYDQALLPASNVAVESTTPPVSPRRLDGTTSGPKSKFQSILKSAQSLFSSSASISAAAKLETLSSPSASRSQSKLSHVLSSPQRFSPSPERAPMRIQNMTDGDKTNDQSYKPRQHLEDPFSNESGARQEKAQPSSKTEKVDTASAKERDIREDAGTQQFLQINAMKVPKAPPPAPRDAELLSDADRKFPLPPTSSSHTPAQPAQPAKSRPVKPTREVAQKPKPQPMSIRVGSTLTRMPMPSSTSFVQEPSTAQTAGTVKQPNLSNKASNHSLQTATSNTSLKSSVSSQSQRKAQVAASAEKKKQEEREAAFRKEEQKKRAALQKQQQQEEARRAERERSVVEEPKKASQRQATEQRRPENSRLRQGSQPPRPANDMGSTLQQEKTAQRADAGPARPPSRLGSTLQSFNRSINQPPTNPAKPAKRPLDDESQNRSTASTYRPTEQPVDAKRRRTGDELNQHPNQPPPLKQQPIRKENGKLSLMGHGYPQAPPPATHHQPGAPVYKAAPVQQGPAAGGRQLKHGTPIDMTQYTSGKIPFAPSNPPATTVHKTPSHTTAGLAAQRAPAKVSPQYPPSESIHLPEPNTDSEDDDSDADMLPVPDWAQADKLQQALVTQEDAPTDQIFGDIPPFVVEEVFKQDKKLKKFRERTSSANWAGPDGLTQEEINRDLAARQRLRANGQWSYHVSR